MSTFSAFDCDSCCANPQQLLAQIQQNAGNVLNVVQTLTGAAQQQMQTTDGKLYAVIIQCQNKCKSRVNKSKKLLGQLVDAIGDYLQIRNAENTVNLNTVLQQVQQFAPTTTDIKTEQTAVEILQQEATQLASPTEEPGGAMEGLTEAPPVILKQEAAPPPPASGESFPVDLDQPGAWKSWPGDTDWKQAQIAFDGQFLQNYSDAATAGAWIKAGDIPIDMDVDTIPDDITGY